MSEKDSIILENLSCCKPVELLHSPSAFICFSEIHCIKLQRHAPAIKREDQTPSRSFARSFGYKKMNDKTFFLTTKAK